MTISEISEYLDATRKDIDDIKNNLQSNPLGVYMFKKLLKRTREKSNYLWKMENNMEPLIKGNLIHSEILEKYSSISKDLRAILRNPEAETKNDELIRKYEVLKKELLLLIEYPSNNYDKFILQREEVKKFEKVLFMANKYIDVDIGESLDFLSRLTEIALTSDEERFMLKEKDIISNFEGKLLEYQNIVKCESSDEFIRKELQQEVLYFKKSIVLESECIKKCKYARKSDTLLKSLLSMINTLQDLYEHTNEHNNYINALNMIQEADESIRSFITNENMENYRKTMLSVKLLIQIMKGSNYKIKLREWLDDSYQIWYKYLNVTQHEELREKYIGETKFRLQKLIEKQNDFERTSCKHLNEAENLLENVILHGKEANKLYYDITRYERMQLFEGKSFFNDDIKKLSIIQDNTKNMINELENEIEREKAFIRRFAGIVKDWKHVIYFKRKNLDAKALKKWKKNGKKFFDEWTTFQLEYRSRDKKFISSDELLDTLSSKNDNYLIIEYKRKCKKVFKEIMNESFRFSLAGQQIKDIIAMKDFDTTQEYDTLNYSDVDINIFVTDGSDDPKNEFEKKQKITVEIKDTFPSEATSGIIEDHEEDVTIVSDIPMDEEVSLDNTTDNSNSDISDVVPNFRPICSSILKASFFALFLVFVNVFILVAYYGREEILPCSFRRVCLLFFNSNTSFAMNGNFSQPLDHSFVTPTQQIGPVSLKRYDGDSFFKDNIGQNLINSWDVLEVTEDDIKSKSNGLEMAPEFFVKHKLQDSLLMEGQVFRDAINIGKQVIKIQYRLQNMNQKLEEFEGKITSASETREKKKFLKELINTEFQHYTEIKTLIINRLEESNKNKNSNLDEIYEKIEQLDVVRRIILGHLKRLETMNLV
uniref:KASH domain-containing protein n=1 Tax=Parastrongyloides trichosuri TaxID=131310 RepID=A0A0N4ZG52_PARTI